MLVSLMVRAAQCCSQNAALKYSFPMWSQVHRIIIIKKKNIKLLLQLFSASWTELLLHYRAGQSQRITLLFCTRSRQYYFDSRTSHMWCHVTTSVLVLILVYSEVHAFSFFNLCLLYIYSMPPLLNIIDHIQLPFNVCFTMAYPSDSSL